MAIHYAPRSRTRLPDSKDHSIATLSAQLRAERDTRETLLWGIRNGVTSPEVLEAIAEDPVPVDAVDEPEEFQETFP
ncbi:hypothetical protein [Rhizobium sp.]|uniref:hypothetical protein n=1 Tax=Rhizobium sp. TaxID=391 RepID=UPI00289A4CE3